MSDKIPRCLRFIHSKSIKRIERRGQRKLPRAIPTLGNSRGFRDNLYAADIGHEFNARRGAQNFSGEEFLKAVRYCRIRGCKVYVTLNTLVNDREFTQAVEAAGTVSASGADAVLVQDLGLAAAIRQAYPDLPVHASTQMSIHNLAGVEAAAQMGITRAVLARELSLEQIRFIAQHASIETEVFVHGALCFCHSGQCYMSSLIGRRSGNRGMCAQPCRMQYSLGGRMDDYPLSLKDSCLVNRLKELEEAGVACVKIEGRMKRPEYTGIVTGIYSKAIKEKRQPSAQEMDALEKAFSRSGFTQGYLNGDKADMFGIRTEPDKESEKLLATARKKYGSGELRRVPVHFYTVAEKGENLKAIAFDNDGNRAVATGHVPERAKNNGITKEFLIEQMYKTGGTPYLCVEDMAQTDPGLYVSVADINELRRKLLNDLSEKRAAPPERMSLPCPQLPDVPADGRSPVMIFQIRTAEQMAPELAVLRPDYLYAPAIELLRNFGSAEAFIENGTVPVAVLPRVITDDQAAEIE